MKIFVYFFLLLPGAGFSVTCSVKCVLATCRHCIFLSPVTSRSLVIGVSRFRCVGVGDLGLVVLISSHPYIYICILHLQIRPPSPNSLSFLCPASRCMYLEWVMGASCASWCFFRRVSDGLFSVRFLSLTCSYVCSVCLELVVALPFNCRHGSSPHIPGHWMVCGGGGGGLGLVWRLFGGSG